MNHNANRTSVHSNPDAPVFPLCFLSAQNYVINITVSLSLGLLLLLYWDMSVRVNEPQGAMPLLKINQRASVSTSLGSEIFLI